MIGEELQRALTALEDAVGGLEVEVYETMRMLRRTCWMLAAVGAVAVLVALASLHAAAV